MHMWGEEGVDWAAIDNAAYFIGHNLRKWGRVDVFQYKEKWGEVRVYCGFGWWQMHSITHPGHTFNRYPNWLWQIDCRYISKVVRCLNWLIVPIQTRLYTHLYQKAVDKWPHITYEILDGADYPELLRRIRIPKGAKRTDKQVDMP